jgi:hypothetical protein
MPNLKPSLLVAGALFASSVGWTNPAGATQFEYRVQHPGYGSIGTYTNTVEKNGDVTTVKSKGNIKVTVLGLVVYRQDIDRTEQWAGNRLINFHGVTTVDGKATEVKGTAEGDHFTIATPHGTVTAPPTIRVADPWSQEIVKGDTLLMPDSGAIEKVQVAGGEETSVAIEGANVRAQHYQVNRPNGEKLYELWFDERGIPVAFNMKSAKGTVTFTLQNPPVETAAAK